MNKAILTLLTVSATVLTVSACTQRTANLPPPGTYEHSSSSTMSDGTKVERETKTDVEVDRYGNKSATTKTTTTKDPEGLFNKSTSTSESKVNN